MTHVLINPEIVTAVGLSALFLGIMLSLIAIGFSFFIYQISKQKRKQFLKMAGLMTAWAIFIILTALFSKNYSNYRLVVFYYPLINLLTTLFGAIIIISWGFMLPKLLKVFDKKLLIIAGIIASISIIERLISPFFEHVDYFGLIMRITIIIPPLLGFFMIIKAYIEGKNND